LLTLNHWWFLCGMCFSHWTELGFFREEQIKTEWGFWGGGLCFGVGGRWIFEGKRHEIKFQNFTCLLDAFDVVLLLYYKIWCNIKTKVWTCFIVCLWVIWSLFFLSWKTAAARGGGLQRWRRRMCAEKNDFRSSPGLHLHPAP